MRLLCTVRSAFGFSALSASPSRSSVGVGEANALLYSCVCHNFVHQAESGCRRQHTTTWFVCVCVFYKFRDFWHPASFIRSTTAVAVPFYFHSFADSVHIKTVLSLPSPIDTKNRHLKFVCCVCVRARAVEAPCVWPCACSSELGGLASFISAIIHTRTQNHTHRPRQNKKPNSFNFFRGMRKELRVSEHFGNWIFSTLLTLFLRSIHFDQSFQISIRANRLRLLTRSKALEFHQIWIVCLVSLIVLRFMNATEIHTNG